MDDILSSNVKIKQLAIEVHHRFKEVGVQKTKDLLKKLDEQGYKIVSISDTREEYTFLKVE